MRSMLLMFGLAISIPGCKASAVPRTFDNQVTATPAAPMPVRGSAVIPGERFSYRISMLGFDAGAIDIAAGQPGDVDGRKVIFLRSRAQSRGVVAFLKTVTDDVTTWVDVDTGHPLYHHTVSKVGDSEEEVEIRYAPGQFDVAETIEGKQVVETQVIPDGGSAYDLMTSLMAIRGWRAEPGDRATMHVLRSTLFWRTYAQYHGPDSLKIAIGRFPAVRVDGMSRRIRRSGEFEDGKEARHFSVWMSDDARRVPLLIAAKTDFGDVRMELVEYQSPDGTLIAASE